MVRSSKFSYPKSIKKVCFAFSLCFSTKKT
uniref:Uncharacterized protein n=1 Tax=Arundo donax TaxID=35708 RepID=A0A0A9C3M4_ARUDO